MDFFFCIKNKVFLVLVILSVINFLRLCFVEGWKKGLAILLLQLWLVWGMYNFACGRAFSIAPGEIGSDAEPWVRISVAIFAFSFYLVVFLKEGKGDRFILRSIRRTAEKQINLSPFFQIRDFYQY